MDTEKIVAILREGFLVKRVRCISNKPLFTKLLEKDDIFWSTDLNLLIICSQGHVVHNWKARWFVLTPDKMLYYKYEGGKRDSCQRGKILLKDCVITCPFLEYENRPVSCAKMLAPIHTKILSTWALYTSTTYVKVSDCEPSMEKFTFRFCLCFFLWVLKFVVVNGF